VYVLQLTPGFVPAENRLAISRPPHILFSIFFVFSRLRLDFFVKLGNI
jgi:protocatechuate 3,4-dioxygenase beta subunit